MNSIFGINIIESKIPLERTVPNRQHKKRRNQRASYHRRVQKKWDKRFGTRVERYAIMMNPKALGFAYAGQSALMDPRDYAVLKMACA